MIISEGVKRDVQGWFITYEKCEFFLPFICHRCGRCCQAPFPRCVVYGIEQIANYLGMPAEDAFDQYFSGLVKRNVTAGKQDLEFLDACEAAPCPFLSSGRSCDVYPDRPEGCRLYPLATDGGAAGVTCPGHMEFHRARQSFFKRRTYCSADALPTNKRRPQKHEWPAIIRKFKKANPSPELIALFLSINDVPDSAAQLVTNGLDHKDLD